MQGHQHPEPVDYRPGDANVRGLSRRGHHGRVGAQHVLNAEYFQRIDALNYTMIHDDGQHVERLHEADVVLVGVSRTSKTPTSIYLGNRGVAAANVPLVPGIRAASSQARTRRWSLASRCRRSG